MSCELAAVRATVQTFRICYNVTTGPCMKYLYVNNRTALQAMLSVDVGCPAIVCWLDPDF